MESDIAIPARVDDILITILSCSFKRYFTNLIDRF